MKLGGCAFASGVACFVTASAVLAEPAAGPARAQARTTPSIQATGAVHFGTVRGADVVLRPLGLDDFAAVALQLGLDKDAGTLFPDKRERAAVLAFYGARDGRPVWIHDGRFTDQARRAMARLQRADQDGLDPAEFAVPALSPAPTPEALAAAELKLTGSVLAYARQAQGGRVNPRSLSPLITVDPPRPEPLGVLEKVSTAQDPAAALDGYNPPHPGFQALRRALAALRTARVTEPPRIPDGRRIARGMRDPRVPMLKERLGVPPGPDPAYFDAALNEALRAFQRGHGLAANGALTPGTLKALNTRAQAVRAEDVLVNMERWRWLPRDLGQRHVMVNIPEFLVRIVEGGATVYEDRVIVGKPTNQTPIFSKAMQHVIVNPYWNVPTSIAVKEMLPRLAADPGYFARQGFELVNARGRVVDPYSVDWRAVEAGRFRFRQPPGERNALGRIKFMFPNQHDVYIHDTPTRSLFANAIRAYSHGCIRVHEPFRFADALLADQGIDGARLKKLIGGPERTLMLKRHIPVHIVYFTAGVGKDGKVEARPDIYGHDARLKATLGLH